MSLDQLPQLILDRFRGRPDVVAYQNGDGFAPHQCPGGIEIDWIAGNHLAGEQCYGFYVLDTDSKCYCSCIDLDNKPDHPDPHWKAKAEGVYWELTNAGVQCVVEVSQSDSGAHVWLFFSEPVDAWIARQFWRRLGESMGIAFREINPKQNRLDTGGKGLGNLVRFPFWNESRFVDIENDWQAVDPVETLANVTTYAASDLRLFAWQMKLGDLQPPADSYEPGEASHGEGISPRVSKLLQKPWTLLARRWVNDTRGMLDGSPSAVAMSIATEMVRLYVPTPEIEAAVRYWLRSNARGSKADRPQWIAKTVGKAYEFVTERIEEKASTTSVLTLQDCVNSHIDLIQQGGTQHIASGLKEFDRAVDGVARGEVCVVAARPSHGKSAFGFQWLDNAAANGTVGLCISEEMSKDEIGKRRLQSISSIEFDKWARRLVPRLREEAEAHFKDRRPTYVVENCGTIDRVEEVIDQMCSIYDVSLVAVDYLQLLGGRGDRYEVVTEASRRIKQCAQRNNTGVLLLSQMNRSVESRNDSTPKMSDLRESGQIEQDADMICFLEWPFKTDPKKWQDKRDKYVITVAKRRNGPIREIDEYTPPGIIVTTFDPYRQVIGKESK